MRNSGIHSPGERAARAAFRGLLVGVFAGLAFGCLLPFLLIGVDAVGKREAPHRWVVGWGVIAGILWAVIFAVSGGLGAGVGGAVAGAVASNRKGALLATACGMIVGAIGGLAAAAILIGLAHTSVWQWMAVGGVIAGIGTWLGGVRRSRVSSGPTAAPGSKADANSQRDR